MELEIFEALTAINVPADNARRAAESIKKEIDERYTSHGQQLATRGDIESVRREVAELKVEMVKWFVGTTIAVGGITAALLKIMN
ncbi:hypothetical protein [Rhodoferax sp.]|uniref:hypothetical protein n=1 Tax=Rhodoferax sp. TaxID=50421 RepID=UPI00263328AB|nr:hypothetical protein [Rhodoferax sp.]MDD2811630.1 hypothetical protein [Rhodoferax sp.]MDD4944363.1 hypothetical protein [Rhodoferax sp.]MDD5478952.1 hypothetical protein [Rhodoferax sp.]